MKIHFFDFEPRKGFKCKEYFDKANERFEKEIHGVEVIGDTIVTQQSLFD